MVADRSQESLARPTKIEVLREYFVEHISRLSPHARLPTERELVRDFKASRMTVRRVLDRLEAEGFVYRVQGSGTYVAGPGIVKTIELTSFSEDMRGRGFQPGSRLLSAASGPAGAQAGYLLGISPVDEVVRIRRVRTADGTPMCLEEATIPSALVPGLLDRPLEGSLYDLLETRYELQMERAEQTVRATVLDPAAAELLDAPPLSPALHVERVSRDHGGNAVELATSLYRGDRYLYEMALRRSRGAGRNRR